MFDGTSPPVQMLRWRMAEQFGWTLDYIDSLTAADLFEYLNVEDGKSKWIEHEREKINRGKRR
jgi:hypothetical protein